MSIKGNVRVKIFSVSAVLLAFFFSMSLNPAWAGVSISPDMIQAKVVEYIKSTTPLNDPQASLIVETLHLPMNIVSLEGEHLKVIMTDSRPTPLIFRTIVQVTLSTEVETKVIGIPVKLSVEKPVWIVTKPISSHEVIKLSSVTLQKKVLDDEASYVVGASENPSIYTAKVNLSPGAILDTHKVMATPIIFRNDDVHLLVKLASGVQVSFYGKAMEDGALGKRIRVSQTLANHQFKIYTGQVINEHTVEVDM